MKIQYIVLLITLTYWMGYCVDKEKIEKDECDMLSSLLLTIGLVLLVVSIGIILVGAFKGIQLLNL